MQYHWESSHYKNSLGLIVLDVLFNKKRYPEFGINLNTKNIDLHLENQNKLRKVFIDTDFYKKEFIIYLK